MQKDLDLLGAIVAHVVVISSIITFASRMIFKLQPGHWVDIPILLMAFPLGYLLLRAPEFNRPFLYYVQIGAMLVWLIVLFLVDYVQVRLPSDTMDGHKFRGPGFCGDVRHDWHRSPGWERVDNISGNPVSHCSCPGFCPTSSHRHMIPSS